MFRKLQVIGVPQDRRFVLGLFLAALESLSAIALLGCSAWLISAAAEQPPIMYLNMVIVGVRGFALGRAFFRYTQRLALHDSAFRLQTQLRPRLFRAVAPLAPAALGDFSRQTLSSDLITDVEEIQNLGVRVIGPLVQAVVAGLGTIIVLAVIAPATNAGWILLASMAAGTVLALGLGARWNRKKTFVAARQRAEIQVAVGEYLENLDIFESYGWSNSALEEINQLQESQSKLARRFNLTQGFGGGVFGITSTVAVVLMSWQGAVAVNSGALDHRMLAVLALIPLAVFEIVAALQPALLGFQKYVVAAHRIQSHLAARPSDVAKPSKGTHQLDVITSFSISKASFAYPARSPVLQNLELHLHPGDRLLVTGPSGTGKSTIAYALAGFLHPVNGNVTVNGLPLTDYSEASLRARIGYLEQSPTIFDGTVRTNLDFAKPGASNDELWRALDRVGLKATFAARQGLDTDVGERGVAISGGEAQRLSLARALLADFQVLIFDEPTANVDADLAEQLWGDILGITAMDNGKISVFITHDQQLDSSGLRRLAL